MIYNPTHELVLLRFESGLTINLYKDYDSWSNHNIQNALDPYLFPGTVDTVCMRTAKALTSLRLWADYVYLWQCDKYHNLVLVYWCSLFVVTPMVYVVFVFSSSWRHGFVWDPSVSVAFSAHTHLLCVFMMRLPDELVYIRSRYVLYMLAGLRVYRIKLCSVLC